MYPTIRLRRNRRTSWLRELIAETTLSPKNLILPIFIVEGTNQRQEIKAMPSVYRQSVDQAVLTAKKAQQQGIQAIALFPCIAAKLKSNLAHEAYNADNLICRAIKAIREADIEIGIICDVALDPYTDHGHDGIIQGKDVDNDNTIEALCKQSLVLAEAGADIVAPSDMMDGRIGSIRRELDASGFSQVNILAYAAKYASNFYGPFREAIGVTTTTPLNKSTYQMDFRNIKEAMREIEQDIAEGADMIMVKPGMNFLDVIHAASSRFNINVFAYQVSGEYAMLKFASLAGALDWQRVMLESLVSFRRAGASAIFTYAALEIATLLNT